MRLREIVTLVNSGFVAQRKAQVRFSRKSWHPNEQWHEDIEHQGERGIYIFCEDGIRCPPEESDAEIWYVGKANSNATRPIAARIFAHFKVVLDPETRERLEGFPHHRWADSLGIDETYRGAIEKGEFLVYTAAISGSEPTLPEDLEKFILYAVSGGDPKKLPPLNTQLPR